MLFIRSTLLPFPQAGLQDRPDRTEDHDLAAKSQKRYGNGVRGFLKRLALKDSSLPWEDHIGGISDFYAWQKEMLNAPRLPENHTGAFTAYIGAFLRPHNIGPIVESLLRTPSVGTVIVSENNPQCLQGIWKPDSARILFLRHDQRENCHRRLVHLSRTGEEYLLMTDDDLFLSPRQLERVATTLMEKPDSPKGICGQRWDGRVLHSNVRSPGDIDVLNRLYAFTKRHLETYMTLYSSCVEQGPFDDRHADDLLLSLSGTCKPAIVDIGDVVDCTSQGHKKIALWRERGFMEARNKSFARMLSLRKL